MDKKAELGGRYAAGFIRKMASAGVPRDVCVALLRKQAGLLGAYSAGVRGASGRPARKKMGV